MCISHSTLGYAYRTFVLHHYQFTQNDYSPHSWKPMVASQPAIVIVYEVKLKTNGLMRKMNPNT